MAPLGSFAREASRESSPHILAPRWRWVEMAMCQVTLGVGSAAPFQKLFREHSRPEVAECAESQPWPHEPLRALVDALGNAVDASAAGASASSSQEDVARLLRRARRQLVEQLDEADVDSDGEPDPLAGDGGFDGEEREVIQAFLAGLGLANPWAKAEAATTSRCERSREAARRLLAADVPSRLVVCLGVLDFEVQKDAIRLFEVLLKMGALSDVGTQIIEYVVSHPSILQLLLEGAGTPKVHWQCAQMIRNCACSPHLVKALAEKGAANRLMELMQHQNFDIASEAFSCLKELLLGQKEVSSEFLEANFQDVFGMWHALLQDEEDYVRQRQALKLLGEILLDRSFMEVMVQYVSNEQFLQIHMKLLRHSSKAIQTDAFHVFKAFVGNPSKPRRVQQILYQNKDKLEKHLSTFYARREGDDAFLGDLNAVIAMIQALEPPPRSQAGSRAPSKQP